jgi:hypothetical protein
MLYQGEEDAAAIGGGSFTESSRQETRMGYGQCSISGCPCAAFKDTYGSDLCNNCGHKFADHW